ncbi:TCERG1 [Acrasis kona]|uniref:TCERG1 n=1 Tax=Acrasis kona TaxID=1008807 RepID=A0AAW2YRT0_9EUKA
MYPLLYSLLLLSYCYGAVIYGVSDATSNTYTPQGKTCTSREEYNSYYPTYVALDLRNRKPATLVEFFVQGHGCLSDGNYLMSAYYKDLRTTLSNNAVCPTSPTSTPLDGSRLPNSASSCLYQYDATEVYNQAVARGQPQLVIAITAEAEESANGPSFGTKFYGYKRSSGSSYYLNIQGESTSSTSSPATTIPTTTTTPTTTRAPTSTASSTTTASPTSPTPSNPTTTSTAPSTTSSVPTTTKTPTVAPSLAPTSLAPSPSSDNTCPACACGSSAGKRRNSCPVCLPCTSQSASTTTPTTTKGPGSNESGDDNSRQSSATSHNSIAAVGALAAGVAAAVAIM